MRDLSRWSKLFGLILAVIFVTGCGASQSHGADDTTSSPNGQSPQVDYLNKKLIEFFCRLPASASTPFLVLAFLTVTALLVY